VALRECAVVGVAIWALAEDSVPQSLRLRAALAAALKAAQPHADALLAHPLLPHVVIGAAVVLVVLYFWSQVSESHDLRARRANRRRDDSSRGIAAARALHRRGVVYVLRRL